MTPRKEVLYSAEDLHELAQETKISKELANQNKRNSREERSAETKMKLKSKKKRSELNLLVGVLDMRVASHLSGLAQQPGFGVIIVINLDSAESVREATKT